MSAEKELIQELVTALERCLAVMPESSPVWSATDDEYRDVKKNAETQVAAAQEYFNNGA